MIGGGARSQFWGRILAAALNRPLHYPAGGELGPAFGAARLGRLAATGEAPEAVCTRPHSAPVVDTDSALADRYAASIISASRAPVPDAEAGLGGVAGSPDPCRTPQAACRHRSRNVPPAA